MYIIVYQDFSVNQCLSAKVNIDRFNVLFSYNYFGSY